MSGFDNPDFYEAQPDGFDVYSWSPTSVDDINAGKPQAPSTQVHLHASYALGRIIWRFKGPGTLDRLIAALIAHRTDVWGVPQDPGVWRIR